MRRFYLISYDISDDKRRNKVFKFLYGWGDRIQFSVFCCQLNKRELLRLKENLKKGINKNIDQIIIVDMGSVEGEYPEPEIDYIGKTWKPEARSQIV